MTVLVTASMGDTIKVQILPGAYGDDGTRLLAPDRGAQPGDAVG